MRKFVFLVACLALGSCQATSGSGSKGSVAAEDPQIINSLNSGKAVVVGDVYYNKRHCSHSTISMSNVTTGDTATIYNGSLVELGIWKYTATVKPGTYRINKVSCGESNVKMNGSWSDVLTGLDEIKKLRSPQFTVDRGEVLHIGAIRINTVKKKTLFSHAKVIVTREASPRQSRTKFQKIFSYLDNPITFTD